MEKSTAGQRRELRTRQAILDAALELTAATGVDGWSMRELAAQVDYTPGALYRYFDSKAALLTALTDDAMDALHALLSDVEPDGSEPDGSELDRLAGLVLAYIGFASDQPARFRLLLVETPSRRVSLDQPPRRNSPYTVLLDAVHDAVGAGALAVTDEFGPEQIAYTIWATAHGMAVLEQTHLRGFDADFASLHRQATRRLLAGLARLA